MILSSAAISLGSGDEFLIEVLLDSVREEWVDLDSGDNSVLLSRFFELNPGLDREEHVRGVRASRRFKATVVLETREGEELSLSLEGLGG